MLFLIDRYDNLPAAIKNEIGPSRKAFPIYNFTQTTQVIGPTLKAMSASEFIKNINKLMHFEPTHNSMRGKDMQAICRLK